MPRSLVVNPQEVRNTGEISFDPIAINTYSATPKQEVKRFGKDAMTRVLYDMLTIREFETMLNRAKP